EDEPDPRERHFTGRRNASMVRDVTQIAGAAKLRREQIVDARAAARFRGEAPEPREGL
ncbi:MAG: sulfurtransferase, partial [Xanthomonadales bacterium]|nr:sulfurtransferase [Xanthomonadales bacterium]